MSAKRFLLEVISLRTAAVFALGMPVFIPPPAVAQTAESPAEAQLPWEVQGIIENTSDIQELPSLPKEPNVKQPRKSLPTLAPPSAAGLQAMRASKMHSLTVGWNMTKLQATALQKALERDGYKNSTIHSEGAGHSILFSGLAPEEASALEQNLRTAGYQPLRVSDLPESPAVRRKRVAQLTAKGRYTVSLEFNDRNSAESAMDQMARDGYPRGEVLQKGERYEVRLGGVEKQEEAAQLRDYLKSDGYGPVRILTGNQEVNVGEVESEMPMKSLTAVTVGAGQRSSAEILKLREQVKSLTEEVERLSKENSLADSNRQAHEAGDASPAESLFYEVRIANGVDEEEQEDLIQQLKRDGYSDVSADATKSGKYNVGLIGFPTENDAQQAATDLMRRGYQFGSVRTGKIVRARYADKPAPLPAADSSR